MTAAAVLWSPSWATSRVSLPACAKNTPRACVLSRAFERASGGEGLEGERSGARRGADSAIAALAGARSLARSVAETDPALSDEILEAAVTALNSAKS